VCWRRSLHEGIVGRKWEESLAFYLGLVEENERNGFSLGRAPGSELRGEQTD